MSRSPKYSRVEADRLRRERREREQLERQRRREEAAARREATALQAVVASARRRAEQLAGRLTAVRQDARAAGLGGDAAELSALLDETLRALENADGRAAIQAVEATMDEVERREVALRGAITIRRRSEAATAQLDAFRMILDELEAPARQRFDALGSKSIDGRLRELEREAPTGSVTQQELDQLFAQLQAHIERVVSAHREHERHVHEGMALVDGLDAQLRVLREDADTAGVPLPDSDKASEVISYLREALADGRVEDVAEMGPQLSRRLDEFEQRLDRSIERISERREMLAVVAETMPGLGFTVDRKSVMETEDGGVSFQARRLTGEGVAIVVEGDQEQHRILYMSEEMQRAAAAGGETGAHACGSLVELAEELNNAVRRDQFVVGDVNWDGKGDAPQLRPSHGATPPQPEVLQRRTQS